MAGPIQDCLRRDQREVDRLLARALTPRTPADREIYPELQARLLRHVAMEENVLLPAISAVRGTVPAIARKLRLDHAAMVSLLVPAPSSAILVVIRDILKVHSTLEDGPEGFHEMCDESLAARAAELVTRLEATPAIRPSQEVDRALMLSAARRALERAGFLHEAASL